MKRYALVTGARTADEVAAYLPDNYRVLRSDSPTLDSHGRVEVVIVGEDALGWTLDDYVRPRLYSGMMGTEEIDLSHPKLRTIEAGA